MKNLMVSIVAGIIVALIVALATYSLTVKKDLKELDIKIKSNSKQIEKLNTKIENLLSLTEKIHEKKSAFDKLVTDAQVRFNDIKGENCYVPE